MLVFEDAHLLAVHKPAGIATHRAAPDAPWGIVEFLLSRRSNLSSLGTHQRLDRETSGVMVFAKSQAANRSLAAQFEQRLVRKTYLLVTYGTVAADGFTATEPVDGKPAATRFRRVRALAGGAALWEAYPETGRTHQVRLHAAAHGLWIVGDASVGAHVRAPRLPSSLPPAAVREPLLLHAARLELTHPADGAPLSLEAPLPGYFELGDGFQRRLEAARILRDALFDATDTNAHRLIHRESDGFPGLTVDRLGAWWYVEDFGCSPSVMEELVRCLFEGLRRNGARLTCLSRHACRVGAHPTTAGPLPDMEIASERIAGIIRSDVPRGGKRENKRLLQGRPPPPDFTILENGVRYAVDPLAPGGIGLFLDQRENRRRIRSLARGARVLNLFAYTCGFSVAAAQGGAAETVNVDLSRRALDRGRQNFVVNGLDPAAHRFFAQEAMDVLRKWTARAERFDIVMADPPSFSRAKSSGPFIVKRDYGKLARAAAVLVSNGGWLFCSANLVGWRNAEFLAAVQGGIRQAGRKIAEQVWMPQPVDFPVTQACPAYFKSVWLRLE